jgi:hypothetical protein
MVGRTAELNVEFHESPCHHLRIARSSTNFETNLRSMGITFQVKSVQAEVGTHRRMFCKPHRDKLKVNKMKASGGRRKEMLGRERKPRSRSQVQEMRCLPYPINKQKRVGSNLAFWSLDIPRAMGRSYDAPSTTSISPHLPNDLPFRLC